MFFFDILLPPFLVELKDKSASINRIEPKPKISKLEDMLFIKNVKLPEKISLQTKKDRNFFRSKVCDENYIFR